MSPRGMVSEAYLRNYNVSIDDADKYLIQGECDCNVLPHQNHWIAAQNHAAMTAFLLFC